MNDLIRLRSDRLIWANSQLTQRNAEIEEIADVIHGSYFQTVRLGQFGQALFELMGLAQLDGVELDSVWNGLGGQIRSSDDTGQ
jgi:hypothetical protein